MNKKGTARADLLAVLLTGLPSGVVPGFQNYTGPIQADMLRLNTAIAPTANPNIYGLLGGDAAGFPNGRRVFDDVVAGQPRCAVPVAVPVSRCPAQWVPHRPADTSLWIVAARPSRSDCPAARRRTDDLPSSGPPSAAPHETGSHMITQDDITATGDSLVLDIALRRLPDVQETLTA